MNQYLGAQSKSANGLQFGWAELVQWPLPVLFVSYAYLLNRSCTTQIPRDSVSRTGHLCTSTYAALYVGATLPETLSILRQNYTSFRALDQHARGRKAILVSSWHGIAFFSGNINTVLQLLSPRIYNFRKLGFAIGSVSPSPLWEESHVERAAYRLHCFINSALNNCQYFQPDQKICLCQPPHWSIDIRKMPCGKRALPLGSPAMKWEWDIFTYSRACRALRGVLLPYCRECEKKHTGRKRLDLPLENSQHLTRSDNFLG